MNRFTVLWLGIVCLAALSLAACGGEKASKIAVKLSEWRIEPGVSEVKTGKVKFEVSNAGSEPHEFVIIKTDLPASSLPTIEGKVDETKVNLIDEIEPFAAGASESVKVKLSPGKYVFICNIVERVPGQPVESHYLQGMATAFVVVE